MLLAGAVREGGGGAEGPPRSAFPPQPPLARGGTSPGCGAGVQGPGSSGADAGPSRCGCVEQALPSKPKHRRVSEATRESTSFSLVSLLLGRWENVGRGRGDKELVTGPLIL